MSSTRIVKVPVKWSVYSTVKVMIGQNETMEDAIEKARLIEERSNPDGGFALPTDPMYVKNSFEIIDDIILAEIINEEGSPYKNKITQPSDNK